MSLFGYKPKYKKAPWVSAFPGQVRHAKEKSPKRIRPTARKAKADAAYNRRVKEWLKGKKCAVFPASKPATQCHHQRGRLGSLLMDERFWIAVSAEGHDKIHRNPEWARSMPAWQTPEEFNSRGPIKLMCARGEWNTPP